jgi:hypothetical protein
MSEHVDFIQNEWKNAVQKLLGRVAVVDAADGATAEHLVGLVLRPLSSDGSYFYYSEPHDTEACMFPSARFELPMVQVGANQSDTESEGS